MAKSALRDEDTFLVKIQGEGDKLSFFKSLDNIQLVDTEEQRLGFFQPSNVGMFIDGVASVDPSMDDSGYDLGDFL